LDLIKVPDETLPKDFIESLWNKIKPHFPYQEPREHQKEAMSLLLFALENGYKNIILEAPVGSGKSVDAMVMGFLGGPFYALTPNIGLQQQYLSEFGEKYLVEVKGRRNFVCPVTDYGADEAPCVTEKKFKCPSKDVCPYLQQRNVAMEWESGVVSNPAYMFRVVRGCNEKRGEGGSPTFEKRPICILDEAHNMESIFLDFLGASIYQKDFFMVGLKMPQITSTEVDDWFPVVQNLASHCNRTISIEQDNKQKERFKKLYSKLSGILTLLNNKDNVSIIKEFGGRGGSQQVFRFQPKKVNMYAPWYFDRLANQRIFVSATIRPFDLFCSDLGLKEEDTFVVSVKESPFPLEHRIINCLKIGQMSKSRIDKTLPKQLSTIKEILEVHKDDRGVILPFTHNIRKETSKYLDSLFPGRVLTHDSSNKRINCPKCGRKIYSNEDVVECECGNTFKARERDYIIEKFLQENDGNHVLLSTYVSEGFDLGGDKNIKFLIVQKVPYPDLGAKEVRDRVLLDQSYYIKNGCDFRGDDGELCQNWGCRRCMSWYTAHATRKIQQFCGRIVRSPEDKGSIYILDTSFARLFKQNNQFFNEYFAEAVKIYDVK